MATSSEHADNTTARGYALEGTLLEICSCGAPCPCFIGEDPDGGACYGVIAFNLERGVVEGVDVSGLTVVNVAVIPGNALAGQWRVVQLVDERASVAQHEALLRAFSGDLGGPLADLAGLVGELVAVERAPVSHGAENASGHLRVDGMVDAALEPIVASPDGAQATLHGSPFSTVAGAPAYVGKSRTFRVNLPRYGMSWSFDGRNTIQTAWHMEHRP
ncbi:DUF1326 domain-containing protein [Aquisalimonas asiatica]|uniref:DUF1326 domain-containing protein n=1 Tax=Aquisalimonas asiatica TaxID=406100 RepID=A0A1H8RKC2_9GAMM|nr:DUF1326 domain-containing protein [Aquisalimonas asiatica]SEO66628.1 hypothetical protein SAMN04488052_10272 [Aquisalimonas asiatica]